MPSPRTYAWNFQIAFLTTNHHFFSFLFSNHELADLDCGWVKSIDLITNSNNLNWRSKSYMIGNPSITLNVVKPGICSSQWNGKEKPVLFLCSFLSFPFLSSPPLPSPPLPFPSLPFLSFPFLLRTLGVQKGSSSQPTQFGSHVAPAMPLRFVYDLSRDVNWPI